MATVEPRSRLISSSVISLSTCHKPPQKRLGRGSDIPSACHRGLETPYMQRQLTCRARHSAHAHERTINLYLDRVVHMHLGGLEHFTRACNDSRTNRTRRIVFGRYVQQSFDAGPTINMPALCQTRSDRSLKADWTIIRRFFRHVNLADQRPVYRFICEGQMYGIVLARVTRHYEAVVGAKKAIFVKVHHRPSASVWEGAGARVTLALRGAEVEQVRPILKTSLLCARRRSTDILRRALQGVCVCDAAGNHFARLLP